jgi:PAS domain S-box-containing protein
MVRAIHQNRPIVINDIATDPSYRAFSGHALQRGFRSMIALPLIAEEQIIGALGVYASQPNALNDQEIALLTELASDLAYGITVLRTRFARQEALRQLRESEANISAVIENTDAAIWSVDHDFRLLALNSAFKQFFGLFYDFAVEPGTSVDVLEADRADYWRSHYERALVGERFRTEIHYTLENQHDFAMEMSFNPIVSESGEITGVTVFGRDITERKRYEEQLQQLNDQLTARNDELLALYDIGRTLTATLNVQEIYRLLYEEVARKRFGAPTFFVALYNETEQVITCDFAMVDGEELDPAQLPPMPLGTGPNSETIRTRQPRIVRLPTSDVENSTPGNFVYVGTSGEPRSALYVPLLSQNTVVGVISVQHEDYDAFKEADMQLLSTLANQAATAIQNARLFTASTISAFTPKRCDIAPPSTKRRSDNVLEAS